MAAKKSPDEIFDEIMAKASSKGSGSSSSNRSPDEVYDQIMSRAKAASHVKQANRFLVDTDKFYRAVDMDTSGENQFNAADYFEERKKQAEELKTRAAAMSLYMNDHADSFSEESYERMMNILSTFDTDVDDVMNRYQPSINAKTGMRAYEDELLAAMDQRQQEQDRWSKIIGFDLSRIGRDNSGDYAVADTWTPEQRYRLGMMQMDDPSVAREYAGQVNAGKDPYVLQARAKSMDLEAERREIDRLQAELDDFYWNADYDATSTNARNAFDQEIKRREKEISDRTQFYNQAKQMQEGIQFASATQRDDFAARSGYAGSGFEVPAFVEDADPDELTYEYINDPDIRTQINRQTNSLAAKGYDLLNEEEVGIYNYYYATEGPAKAQQYLNNIQDTLNQRIGERGAETKQGNIWKQLMAGAISDYSNAVTAPQYFFDKDSDHINTNPSQYMSAAIREDLADTGPVLPGVPGGASLGQIAFDLVNTTANMAPSILLSTAANAVLPGSGAFIGAATMGLSSAGGAYQQALNAGYSKKQSRAYAALSGASEAGMEYLLGGISKLGGEIPQKVLSDIVRGVDNAIAKAALTIGGDMVSEGFEEGLQEIITPWLENLVLYADKDVNWDDVAYSTLLGALSGGVMEGPRVAVNTTRVSKVDKQLQNLGAKGNTWDLAELIVKHRSGEQLSQEDYIKLVKSEPAMKILEGMRSAEPAEPAIANMTAEQVDEMKPSTSADGNAIQISRNASINVVEFADIKDGKATVKTDSGTVDYSDVSFGTEKQGNQYFAVESLPSIDTAHANDLLRTIQNADVGNDTAEVVAIREAYRLGYMGASTRDLRGSDANILPTKLQDQIYDIGRQQRSANDAVRATVKAVPTKATGKYKKVIIEGKLSNLTGDAAKKRKAEIAYVDRVADTFAGTAVHVYESYEKNGKRYYKDNSGKEQLAPNGKYVNDEIWVDLNSGDKGEGMMLNTFAHEMYHHIEKWNKPKARELAEFVVKELGLESVDKAVQAQIEKARAAGYGEEHFKGMTPDQAQNEVYMRAMSDFVADSLETMFTRGDPAKAIANLKKENRGLFDQIKAFIDEWISKVKKFYSDKTISQEGAMVAQLEKFEQLQQLFMEAMAGAGENYNASLESITPGEAGIMVNEAGDPVAMSTEDGSVMLSIRTYEEDGREAFRKYLDKCVTSNRLTEAEAKEMRDGIEEIYNTCKEFKDKYAPFSAWSDAEVIRDTRGRPVFSVVTPNGDYKMNLDFSLVCKKRRTLDAVFNEMSRRGIIDDFELGQKSVVKINEIIRKYGLETACSLCFVDAKRFRQASMADSFVRLYNELVESLVPEDQNGNIDHFNFSGYETIKKVDGGIDTWANSQLDFSHLDDVMKRYGKGTVEHKAAKYIKSRPEARKLLLRGDFMSSQGFDAVKTQNKDILKLYNSKKGTGGPKAAFGDVQYLNEIIKKERTWTPSKAYEVGGIRIQSFSDYVPRMVFDYTQMIYDLAARKLPAHAYTKESLFVKQFGLTGVKINMSLIPAVAEGGIAAGLDAKGNYVWAGESFNYDEAVEIQNTEGYSENCGTICVGVSKQHIEKLLRDPNIRMVIPYHKSGLNPIVAHMNKIAEFTDYTNDQRTKGKDGKAVSKDFNFNEAVKRTGDPKAAADEYLKWCADNGYTAKFDEFKGEDNYYKLLEDFTLYDKDGKYVPQREVRAVFPKEGNAFGTMKDLIKAGLEEDAIVEGKRDKNLSSIVDEIQKTLPKTEAEISEEQVAQADRDLEAFSLRNEKLTNRQILEQLDIAKRKPWERDHLQRYQERRELLSQEKPKLDTVNARIKELSADPKQNKAELTQLKAEARALKRSVDSLSRKIREQEQSEMFKRIATEERLRLMKETGKNAQKSYKNEQRKMVEAMNMDQRMIREMLTGTQSLMSRMEDNFIDLVKAYENKEIDRNTMRTMFVQLGQEYDQQTKDTKIWDREFSRLMKMYDELSEKYIKDTGDAKKKIERLEATIAKQRADAIERTKARAESAEVQKQRKHVEDNAKKLMKILANPTKDAHVPMALQEPLQKFLDSIDFTSNRYASGGSATIKDRSYTNALAKVRDAIKGQRTALTSEDGVFTLDVPPEFTDEIDKHIKMVSDATEGLDLTTKRVYEMTGAELKDLNYILNTINKAIRDIDRMHMQGEKARTSGLARDTMQEMQNRKPIKGEKGNWFVWNNYTPFHAFRRYGKAALKIFDGLKAGQAKLARTIDSVVKFTEKTYTAKEVKEWERTRHEIKLDSGKTVTMSSAQIMTFWCLSHRDQAIPHMHGAGIRMTTLEKFVNKANSQNELVQKDHFSLTLEDVNRINQLLTDRQRTVAREMQQFMQNFGGKLVNEISMARWDFMSATEKDYFPIDTVETSRDVKNPDQKKTSLFALLNKSFTKAPVQNARNAMVIDSIFNVFANHMSEVAEYNAFALPLVDTMKWFNYRENVDVGEGHIHDVGVNRAIRDTLGTEAIQYFVDLMTDINSSQKAGRHEDFFGKILGRSKAASVAWNTRVAIQQISALPRASMILNYKSLIKGASKVRLKYATQEMMKYSGIALWKSMGYYDLNVGKSVERQIKGDTSIVDKFNEAGMWLPGKMDERTWARIWIATKDQVQNTTHLTGEDLLQATAKKFEEVVYETQVVDSVLTKSSFMRDKNLFIKEATSFMAEPTLAINILMSAFQDYEEGHSRSEKVKRGLMIGFTGYALAGVVNALLNSFSDAWRDDDEFEDYWEKYRQALFGEKFFDGNLFGELNPIEKIAFVKDILSVAKGNEPHSTYSKLMTDAVNLINSYQSIADGKGSKTAYGVVYQTLQYLSTASGVGMSNMTREVIDVWNNTIGKINPEKRILRHKPDNGDELLNAIQKGTEEDIQRVFGRFENQQKAESALQSAIRAKYVSGEMTAEEAEEMLTTYFDRDDEFEIYWLMEEWDYAKENDGSSDGYTKYGSLYDAIETGEYETEIARLLEHGADASTIRSQITREYRKQYMADETAREDIREKLLPVYEATGMYVDDIEDKFNDWNFEAEYGMTYGEFKAEYREGMVTETEMREAMKFYGLMNYEIAEEIRGLNDEIKFVNQYDMTLTDMKDAYDHGDVTRNQMTNALVFSGMTQMEAREWVKERDIENRLGIDYAKLDDAYKHNDISRATLYNAMIEHGATKQEADDAILGYDWLKKHVNRYPDLAISDAKKFAVRISTNAPDYTLEDFGVKIDDYIQYSKLRPDCKGVDRNGDGQADSGTKRDAIFSMIDSLPISSEAKDGLALIDYGMKSIKKNAPWH